MKIRTVVGLICTFFSNVNVLIDKIEIKLKTHVFFSASASIKAPKTCQKLPSDFTYTYVYADHTGKIGKYVFWNAPPPLDPQNRGLKEESAIRSEGDRPTTNRKCSH